jgi:hypothetical protein
MTHLRIREIIDELNHLGGMTPSHHALITELVATCLLAAGPKPPMTGTERSRLCRGRKKEVCNDATLHVAESAVDNNIITNTKNKTTTPTATTNVARGSRLPDDWHPPENLWAWGKEKLPESELKFETAAMRDYFHAQSGQRGVKLDWGKTWKTWIREAVRRRSRFKPKADNVTTFKPSSGVKWLDVSTQYIEKWGRELALKKYNEDLDKGEVLGWLKPTLPAVHRNSA